MVRPISDTHYYSTVLTVCTYFVRTVFRVWVGVEELLRGTLVNRTYGGHENLCIDPFLLTMFGPIYYRPP